MFEKLTPGLLFLGFGVVCHYNYITSYNDLIECYPQKMDETLITMQTPNKQSTIVISAVPLPAEATKLLEQNVDLLKELDRRSGLTDIESGAPQTMGEIALSESALIKINELKHKLGDIFNGSKHSELHGAVDLIWSVGPRRCGPNVLIMRHTDDVGSRHIWSRASNKMTASNNDSSFVNGFQLATLSGNILD